MISATEMGNVYDLRGLSTDTKPVKDIGNGSTFLEIDTSKVFAFDAVSKTWKELK